MTIYQPPDPPEVPETLCIKVLIPKHQKYISAFWSAYTYFGKWVAWERDGTDKATRAAQLWKSLIDQSRAAYDAGENCDLNIIDVRQNPDDPCILEYDAGEGWVQFADMELCKNYDPNLPPQFPDLMEEEERHQYIANLIAIPVAIFAELNPDDSITDITTALTTNAPAVPALFGDRFPFLVTALRNVLAGADPLLVTGLVSWSASIYNDIVGEVFCEVEPDGSWLDRAAQALFDWLNSSSDWLFQALNAVFGQMSQSMFELTGGGGAGFTGDKTSLFPTGSPACFPCRYFDFTIDEQGWYADREDITIFGLQAQIIADYSPGVGWLSHDCPMRPEHFGLVFDLPTPCTIEKMRVTFNAQSGDYGASKFFWFDSPYQYYYSYQVLEELDIVPGVHTYEFVGPHEVSQLVLHMWAISVSPHMICQSIEIELSAGTVPSAGSPCAV